jgi:hypothetical protein
VKLSCKLIAAVALCLFSIGALISCAPPDPPTKAIERRDAPRPGATLTNQSGEVYVASLIIQQFNTDYGVALAIEPQTASFPTGDLAFVVLNKWSSLPVGDHREVVRAIAPDGRTILHEETTDFTISPGQLSLTIVEPMALTGAVPGLYQIALELDGRVFIRYPFEVITRDRATP